jgi:hypothetical protein
VYESYLYKQELQDLLAQTVSPEDSANITRRYIENWMKKQLLYREAASKVKIDMAEVEKRVQEYRYQLINFAYQKQYIEDNLDTLVTDAQILDYYNANQDDFELKQNIVKAILMRISNEAPNLDKVRKWLRSDNPDDIDELKSYAYGFDERPRISDSTWINFDILIDNTPFADIANRTQYVSRTRYDERSDDTHHYFLRIMEFRIADEVSPVEFVKQSIADIIINKRKIELQQQLEDKLIKEAGATGNYEIFTGKKQ